MPKTAEIERHHRTSPTLSTALKFHYTRALDRSNSFAQIRNKENRAEEESERNIYPEQVRKREMAELWEGIYCVSVVIMMFVMLLKNVAGPDILMLGALALELAAGIVPIPDGLKGFSNKGLLTVACLFVVAAGISNTGALDYYMGKLLGNPKTVADAQLRLMAPIAVVSAFLNNTPVVAIMIPIVQKWCRKCKIDPAQLFIPLSFASILGGTCTLIGTSTNLVVDGMRRERYPDAETIGLFDLSKYGIPVLLSGLCYTLLASPYLLPGGVTKRKKNGEGADDGSNLDLSQLTVGAVVPRGSPVVDSPVQDLRGLNGLYLVSVQRGDSVMRAVQPEFLLEAGDVLIFTGLVDKIGEVCEEHGLVPLTHDVEEKMVEGAFPSLDVSPKWAPADDPFKNENPQNKLKNLNINNNRGGSSAGNSPRALSNGGSPKFGDDSSIVGLGLAHRKRETELQRRTSVDVHNYEKILRKFTDDGEDVKKKQDKQEAVMKRKQSHEYIDNRQQSLAVQKHFVLRARIGRKSSLIDMSPREVLFRRKYKASIMAVQRAGATNTSSNVAENRLGKIIFQHNDILILHASEDSPLLVQKREREKAKAELQKVREETKKSRLAESSSMFRSSSKVDLAASGDKSTRAAAGNLSDMEGFENTSEFTCGDEIEVLLSDASKDLNFSEFAIPMRVVAGGALDGKTIRSVDLHNTPGLFITAMQEGGAAGETKAVDPDTVLRGEDVLWFAGDMGGMQTLRRIPGIITQDDQVSKLTIRKNERRLVQAVISQHSSLEGKSVRDTQFRTRFDAVIIAVQRSGGRVQSRIGDIVLQAGDVLLLDTSKSFLSHHKRDPSFALVSEIADSAPPQFDKLLPSMGTAVVMIAVFVAGALDLFVAALLASGVMLATGCLTQEQARASVKWDVIVTIAAAFGISAAMEQSGVASAIATNLVAAGNSLGTGKTGILVAIYLATVVLCNIVGNNAAAALMFPIAAGSAEQQGIDNAQMSFLLMLAASASFMSPFGYQTNLMVYGPGGYVFANFLKFGGPMQVVQMIVSVAVILLDDKWWIGWVVGFGGVFAIAFFRLILPIILDKLLSRGNNDASAANTSIIDSDKIIDAAL